MEFTGLHHITMITGDAQRERALLRRSAGPPARQEDGQLRPAAGLPPLLRGRDRARPARSSRGSSSPARRAAAPARERSTRSSSRSPTRPRSTSGSSVSTRPPVSPGVLRFADYDGLQARARRLRSRQRAAARRSTREIPAEHAIAGLHGVRAYAVFAGRPGRASSPTLLGFTLRGRRASTCSTAPSAGSASPTTRRPPGTTSRAPAASTTSPGPRATRTTWPGRSASRDAGGYVTDVRDRDYFQSIYFRDPERDPVRDRDALARLRRRRGPRAPRRGAPAAQAARAPARRARGRRCGPSQQPEGPGMSALVYRGAPRRRHARGPARPPPRPRRRRARPARPRRRARPGAAAARRHARRPAADPGLAGQALVRRAARRLPGPRHVPGRLREARALPRRDLGAHRHDAGEHRLRRLLDGLGHELLARARPGPPGAGRDHGLQRLHPDRRRLAAGRSPTRHARVHRPRPPRPGDGRPVRPRGARPAGGRRPRRHLPRVRRRPPHRPRAPARRGRVAARHVRSDRSRRHRSTAMRAAARPRRRPAPARRRRRPPGRR